NDIELYSANSIIILFKGKTTRSCESEVSFFYFPCLELVRTEITTTNSEMPQARAYKVVFIKQLDKNPSNCSGFLSNCIIL
ncbi:hypothetical protein, partial [Flavobacterium branchiophilum]|uniref:hypothetical protein n=1 Tax=Flavobacterium branchiophilum TaxID=55197 RepID=UPI001CC0EB2D